MGDDETVEMWRIGSPCNQLCGQLPMSIVRAFAVSYGFADFQRLTDDVDDATIQAPAFLHYRFTGTADPRNRWLVKVTERWDNYTDPGGNPASWHRKKTETYNRFTGLVAESGNWNEPAPPGFWQPIASYTWGEDTPAVSEQRWSTQPSLSMNEWLSREIRTVTQANGLDAASATALGLLAGFSFNRPAGQTGLKADFIFNNGITGQGEVSFGAMNEWVDVDTGMSYGPLNSNGAILVRQHFNDLVWMKPGLYMVNFGIEGWPPGTAFEILSYTQPIRVWVHRARKQTAIMQCRFKSPVVDYPDEHGHPQPTDLWTGTFPVSDDAGALGCELIPGALVPAGADCVGDVFAGGAGEVIVEPTYTSGVLSATTDLQDVFADNLPTCCTPPP